LGIAAAVTGVEGTAFLGGLPHDRRPAGRDEAGEGLPRLHPHAWSGDFDHLFPEDPDCAMLSARIRNCLA